MTDEIAFVAPDGSFIAGALQTGGEDRWPVIWDERDGRAAILEYQDAGPGGVEWDTVVLDDEAVFVEEGGRPWLERHLIRYGSQPLAASAIAIAQRDYYAASAVTMANALVDDLRAGSAVMTAGRERGPVGALVLAAEAVCDDCIQQAAQLKRFWLQTLAAEQAMGRGVPLPPANSPPPLHRKD